MYPKHPSLQTEDTPDLVDTHCHLDIEPLFSNLPEVLSLACRAGVTRFVVPGVHPGGWERMAALAGRQEGVFAAYGVHPMHAGLVDTNVLARLEAAAAKGIAIGEIGLDPSYTVSMEIQEHAFREQLHLAYSLELPVLIHCRRAFQRTLQIVREEKVYGIMHAFSGSVEMAREFIRLGFFISLSGTFTWTNALRPVRLAQELPLESLVLETDAPDLSPQAFRGMPNQPAYLENVLLAVAKVCGMDPREVARQTTKNAMSLFHGAT